MFLRIPLTFQTFKFDKSNVGQVLVLITDQGKYLDSVDQYEEANTLKKKEVNIISVAVGSSWIIPTFLSQLKAISAYKPFETSYDDLSDHVVEMSELICSGKKLFRVVFKR